MRINILFLLLILILTSCQYHIRATDLTNNTTVIISTQDDYKRGDTLTIRSYGSIWIPGESNRKAVIK